MRKLLFTIFACLISYSTLFGQQKEFEWRLGVSGGYSNYYGDLTPYRIRGLSNMDAIHHLLYFNENYFDQYSFKISLEKKLSPTVGLQFSYAQYQFAMSDRYIKRNGDLLTTSRNFDRALNFQNNTRDMGLSFVFKTDNDKFLSSKSLLAPYFTLGFGFLDFDIKGDLLDDNGNMYDYLNPETVNNGIYETELSPLRTELENGYDNGTLYANFGLGIRLRLGNRLEIFAQSDFIHSFTGYLDDVSGTYRETYDNSFQAYAAKPGPNVVDPTTMNRGRNNGLNDWIIYHGVGLKFNFGASKSSFHAPRLSTRYPDYNQAKIKEPIPKEVSLVETEVVQEQEKPVMPEVERTGNTYTYYTNIQLSDDGRVDYLEYITIILTWDQQISDRKDKILEGKLKERSLLDIQKNIADQQNLLATDTLLRRDEKDSLIAVTEKNLSRIGYSLDSIQTSRSQLEYEIDSISKLKSVPLIRPKARQHVPDSTLTPTGYTDSLYSNPALHEDLELGGDEVLEYGEMIDSDSIAAHQAPIRLDNGQLDSLTYRTENQFSEIDTTKPLVSNIDEFEADQEFQKKNSDQTERIQYLEAESRKLRSERDSLNSLPREIIYMGGSSATADQATRSNTSFQRQPTNTYHTETVVRERVVQSPTVRRERSGRNFWQTIGAFFGGAAVGKAVSSNKEKDTDQAPAAPPAAELDLATINRINNAAVIWSFLNLGIDQNELKRLAKNASEERLAMEATKAASVDVSPQEVVIDTVYIENDPEFKLLKSKEIIYFKVNQKEPDQDQIEKLENLIGFVKENREYQLLLTGYADNTGNIAYNLRLANERMKAVANTIEEKYALDSSQIAFESGGQVVRGPQRSSNDLDRKVEVRIEKSN
ncbi:OmpA family protein [Belliella marina]|uniref:OmpA family protein n=1 Tax=Belliella marina TaxID=1644146 RepID=A0ABW4VST8_9BACT